MNCPNIVQLKFSHTRITAINEIRSLTKTAHTLTWAIGIGNVTNILLGNNLIKASYTLYSTDFEVMAKAMRAVPAILKRRIADIASMTYMKVTKNQERTFWEAIVAGCNIKQ